MNLTTLTRFRQFAGMTGTSQDALITALIPQVSDQIAKYLKRDLAVTTYLSWVDGTGSPILRLEQWPILSLYQVFLGTETAGYIENTSTTVSRASVSFDGTNLSLTSISTTGTVTTTDLPVGTSKILSTLKTAIELVSGWFVTLNSTDYNSEPTSMLRPIYAASAVDPDTADLVLPDSPVPVKVIAEDMIELLNSGNDPVGFGGGSIVEGFDATTGIGPGFPSGSANILVWYKAGYTLPSDAVTTPTPIAASDGTLPPGLALLVHQILQDVLSSTKFNSNLQSENIGNYSYSLSAQDKGAVLSALNNRKKDLDLFKRITI
ncbi:MAG: phage head-tail connector protein [Dehalococcoidia bacterium]